MPATATASLHMVQLTLRARRLAQLGKMMSLPLARTRLPYLVHCALGKLFQDQAPKPFHVHNDPRAPLGPEAASRRDGRLVRVLGYASVDRDTLHEIAKGFAEPVAYAAADWDEVLSKPMPEAFPEGMRLRFELRACPVIRKGSAGEGVAVVGDRRERRTWKKGEELDAFLNAAWTNPDAPKPDRETVYRAWLVRQLELRGGAVLEDGSFAMERFSIERMTRRTHDAGDGRRTTHFQAPDATFTGRLTVTDSDAFDALLRSGLGRHKSFGYGMLKVRRG